MKNDVMKSLMICMTNKNIGIIDFRSWLYKIRWLLLWFGGREEEYEWLMNFDDLWRYLSPHLDPFISHVDASEEACFKVLVIGCGNSSLSHDLDVKLNGRCEIVSLDFSSIVIQKMEEK